MRLVGTDDRVLKVFSITGLDKVFELHADLDSALRRRRRGASRSAPGAAGPPASPDREVADPSRRPTRPGADPPHADTPVADLPLLRVRARPGAPPASPSTASPNGSAPWRRRPSTASSPSRPARHGVRHRLVRPARRAVHPRRERSRPRPSTPSAALGVTGAVALGLVDPGVQWSSRPVRPAPLRRRRQRLVGRVRPLRGAHRRCAAPRPRAGHRRVRPPSRRGRSGARSSGPSTSAPAAGCRPCTSRPTPGRIAATDISTARPRLRSVQRALDQVRISPLAMGDLSNPLQDNGSRWS